jgi:hypothetical protein
MPSNKATKWQSISVEYQGRTYSGDLEIQGTRSLNFVVHYCDRAESDGRQWGTDAGEQHNMIVMAQAKLLQMVTDRVA